MSLFTMTVTDTFFFEDGTTAFVGCLETSTKTIPPCACEIMVGNEVKASVWIDGEMILEQKQSLSRAISTRQQIDLGACGVGRAGFIIQSKD